MRKKLGKKVLSGSMTVDEARAKLGRQFAQKGADEPQEAVAEVGRRPGPRTPAASASDVPPGDGGRGVTGRAVPAGSRRCALSTPRSSRPPSPRPPQN